MPEILAERSRKTFPRFIAIEPLRACNARCVFCPHSTGQVRGVGGKMLSTVYEKIVTELAVHAGEVQRVGFDVFNETLLDVELPERIRTLKRIGIPEVAVTTNAHLLSEEMGIALLDAGVDIVRMSISSVDPEKHRVFQAGLDSQQVLINAERYFSLRDKINPNSRIYVSMIRLEGLTEEDIENWRRHWSRLTQQGDMLKVTTLFDVMLENREGLGGDRERKPCLPMMQTMCIIYSGHATLCCADYYGVDSPYLLGNVAEQTLAEIWNGDSAKQYRSLHATGRRNEIEICRGCDMWDSDIRENYNDCAKGTGI